MPAMQRSSLMEASLCYRFMRVCRGEGRGGRARRGVRSRDKIRLALRSRRRGIIRKWLGLPRSCPMCVFLPQHTSFSAFFCHATRQMPSQRVWSFRVRGSAVRRDAKTNVLPFIKHRARIDFGRRAGESHFPLGLMQHFNLLRLLCTKTK